LFLQQATILIGLLLLGFPVGLSLCVLAQTFPCRSNAEPDYGADEKSKTSNGADDDGNLDSTRQSGPVSGNTEALVELWDDG
jgi:hypothetical protein